MLPWSNAGFDLYSAALVANETFLAERPDVARRFIEAFAKSLTFALKTPQRQARRSRPSCPG